MSLASGIMKLALPAVGFAMGGPWGAALAAGLAGGIAEKERIDAQKKQNRANAEVNRYSTLTGQNANVTPVTEDYASRMLGSATQGYLMGNAMKNSGLNLGHTTGGVTQGPSVSEVGMGTQASPASWQQAQQQMMMRQPNLYSPQQNLYT